jgi:energy-coupling factor transporter transmembrane protein EcfT
VIFIRNRKIKMLLVILVLISIVVGAIALIFFTEMLLVAATKSLVITKAIVWIITTKLVPIVVLFFIVCCFVVVSKLLPKEPDDEFFTKIVQARTGNLNDQNSFTQARKSFAKEMQDSFKVNSAKFTNITVNENQGFLVVSANGITKQNCITLSNSKTLITAKNSGFTKFICGDTTKPENIMTFELDK